MGYQEILMKSAKMSLENVANIIREKSDPMFIDSMDTVATLRNDFTSDKVIVFGREVDMNPVNLKAGDQFLVVCGERSALDSIKNMFPYMQRKSIEVYPMESIMQSPENLGKEYKDVFHDSKIVLSTEKESVRTKLSHFRAKAKGAEGINDSRAYTERKQRDDVSR